MSNHKERRDNNYSRPVWFLNYSKIKEGITDILLPRRCLNCGREGQYICDSCEILLNEASNERLILPNVMTVWEYEGLVKKAILKVKQEGCYDIISGLVNMAFQKIELSLSPDTYITYVPVHKKKEKQRGFNQAELIARQIARLAGRKVTPLLTMAADKPLQTSLISRDRVKNVKNAFLPLSNKDKPRSVLLVDDFYATGATLKECMKILANSGVKNVYGFTLARDFNI